MTSVITTIKEGFQSGSTIERVLNVVALLSALTILAATLAGSPVLGLVAAGIFVVAIATDLYVQVSYL